MAALTALVCHTLRELYVLADAFLKNDFHLNRTVKYYKTKQRLELFKFYCQQAWLRTMKRTPAVAADGIDFAAFEATAMVCEMEEEHNCNSIVAGAANFLNAERNDFKILGNYDDIEIVNGLEFNASFYEYSDMQPKYFNNQIGQLCEGVSYTFTGRILINCERFSINFVINNDHRDVALHINPRLPQNYIVRNTKVHNVWGQEEVSSALPFRLRRGDIFSIQVLVTESCYMISVNGQHFAEYKHRLPFREVNLLEVKGDVEQIEMQRHVVMEYPKRLPDAQIPEIRLAVQEPNDEVDSPGGEIDGTSIPQEWRLIQIVSNAIHGSCLNAATGLSLPYYGVLPTKSLTEGRCLKIEGRVRLLPHSFFINLQQGQNIWPHPIIAFHFNPRFSKQCGAMGKAIVCRNAWYDGQWADEERSELDTNFRPGKTFSLAIVCAANGFEVYVNRQFLTEYKYRVKPDIVDSVYIQGDIKLWDVVLESNSMVRGKNTRIYNNPTYSEEY